MWPRAVAWRKGHPPPVRWRGLGAPLRRALSQAHGRKPPLPVPLHTAVGRPARPSIFRRFATFWSSTLPPRALGPKRVFHAVAKMTVHVCACTEVAKARGDDFDERSEKSGGAHAADFDTLRRSSSASSSAGIAAASPTPPLEKKWFAAWRARSCLLQSTSLLGTSAARSTLPTPTEVANISRRCEVAGSTLAGGSAKVGLASARSGAVPMRRWLASAEFGWFRPRLRRFGRIRAVADHIWERRRLAIKRHGYAAPSARPNSGERLKKRAVRLTPRADRVPHLWLRRRIPRR